MKFDMMLLANPSGHLNKVCDELRSFYIDVEHITDAYRAKAGLALRSPAFLLLDYNREGANLLLHDITRILFRPCPYIIVSTLFSDGADRASLLRLGADICIDSPIDTGEVLAVIHAVQRRERRIAGLNFGRLLPCVEYKDLKIDPLRRTVVKAGEQLPLTAKEFDVLYVLAYHMGIVLTKEEIHQSVWGGDYRLASSNVARNISYLRQKMGLDKDGKSYVQTIFGVGYRFGNAE